MSTDLSGWHGKTGVGTKVSQTAASLIKGFLLLFNQTTVSINNTLYMWRQSKVQHWCCFTQMFYSLSTEGCMFKMTFLLRMCSTLKWTDKTVTSRLLLFPFVTGKHAAACYQIKQDKFKKPSSGLVTGNNIQKQCFVQVKQTHCPTLRRTAVPWRPVETLEASCIYRGMCAWWVG